MRAEKNKSSLILFAYNLMIGYSKRIEKIIRESAFDEKKKKPGLKFNPRLALTGLRTTGARSLIVIVAHENSFLGLGKA